MRVLSALLPDCKDRKQVPEWEPQRREVRSGFPRTPSRLGVGAVFAVVFGKLQQEGLEAEGSLGT